MKKHRTWQQIGNKMNSIQNNKNEKACINKKNYLFI